MIVIDIMIIIFLIFGFLVGASRGAIKQAILSVGSILILYISFKLKGLLAMFLYTNIPLHISALSKIKTLNYLVYEVIAFIIIFLILLSIFKLVLSLANVLDKAVKMTIILAIPSKIIGGILGFIETYILLFILITILTLPVFNLNKYFVDSKIAPMIINKTPILSDVLKPLTNSIKSINDINLKDLSNTKSIEEQVFIILLKNGIISKDKAKDLIDTNEIQIDNADALIERWAK